MRSFVFVVCLVTACTSASVLTGPSDAAPSDAATGFTDATVTSPGCAAQGGICVLGRWAHCPVGTQPTVDIHADCAPGAGRGNFCCVPAPAGHCVNNSGLTNCFKSACHDCWSEAPVPQDCEAGRVCCEYSCGD